MPVLRSTGWDGPAPKPGDVVEHDDGSLSLITAVAAGPGVGQWRLDVEPLGALIRWRSDRIDCLYGEAAGHIPG